MPSIDLNKILPADWEKPRGYSYAVRAKGDVTIHVAGQLGVEKGALPVPAYRGFAEQWDLALGNVVHLVQEAGGEASNIATMRVYVTSIEDFNSAANEVGAAWATHMGSHFPAMTLLEVPRLLDPRAKVEIEAEAVLVT